MVMIEPNCQALRAYTVPLHSPCIAALIQMTSRHRDTDFLLDCPAHTYQEIIVPIREPVAEQVAHIGTPGSEEWAGKRARHAVDLSPAGLHDVVYHSRTNMSINKSAALRLRLHSNYR